MPAQPQQDQSLVHREMARRAQDIYRVKNPTNEDFKIVWDSFVTDTVPAGGTADIETYKMEAYLRQMTDKILLERQDKAVKEENEKREKQGKSPMEKHQAGEQPIFEGKFAFAKGVQNPEARREIYNELYVGLVKEYGVEEVERVKSEVTPTTHEQIMGELLGRKAPESQSKPPILDKEVPDSVSEDLQSLKQPQLRKIARNKGLEESKTDKKQALIERISQA